MALEGTSRRGPGAALALRRRLALGSQAARSDATAFAAAYERHHRALFRYCRALLHDDDEARDALQSTMASALAALQSEERDFELRPWLFRIAHNEAVSRLRRRREAVGLEQARALGSDSLEQAVEDRERLGHLRADLRDLPERQRAALVLRELNGLGHEEIAAVLGGSPRAVKQTIFEARSALHECAEGRAMLCAEVQRSLSDGDGRVLRGRRLRAHLRSCRSCRDFRRAIGTRRAEIEVLAPPVPAAAGAGLAALAPSGVATVATTDLAGGFAGTLVAKAALVAAVTAAAAGVATSARTAGRDAPPPVRPAVAAGVPTGGHAPPAPRHRVAKGGSRPPRQSSTVRRRSAGRPAPAPSAGGSRPSADALRPRTQQPVKAAEYAQVAEPQSSAEGHPSPVTPAVERRPAHAQPAGAEPHPVHPQRPDAKPDRTHPRPIDAGRGPHAAGTKAHTPPGQAKPHPPAPAIPSPVSAPQHPAHPAHPEHPQAPPAAVAPAGTAAPAPGAAVPHGPPGGGHPGK